MSLLGRELKQQAKMKQISKIVYEPYKITTCASHHLLNQMTCLHKNCPFYSGLFCKDCHLNHNTLNINKIGPRLAIAVKEQWSRIMNDHKQIEQEWKHCLVNINYCLDILNQVKKQVQERSQRHQLSVFNDIMNQTYSMLRHDSNNVSAEMLLKNFTRLNEKYNLFVDQSKTVSNQIFEQDRKIKKQQVKQASRKTKQFSQSALAFSQDLAKIIEEKLKYQKRVSRLRDISNLRVFTLKDLQKQKVDVQEVNQLLIQLPKQQIQKDGDDVPVLLQKCHNLKSLRINNKNGRLDKHKWKPITASFDYLKQLRQLILNIRGVDLKIITELFKQRSKAVRQIQSLTLQITDEKILNVVQVYQFINTMELRNLHLTLARDNVDKVQMIELIKGVRMGTSMTELPMNEVIFNLNKNKVTEGKDLVQVTAFFNSKAQKIKTRSIVL